jgi:hypothetical protein
MKGLLVRQQIKGCICSADLAMLYKNGLLKDARCVKNGICLTPQKKI